jgi:predicted nucleic acid-binding protein
LPFIDTNIFVAALNRKDKHHKKGRELLAQAFKKFSWLQTSDYILSECLTVAWARTRNPNLIQQLDSLLQESEKIQILKVNETTFATAKTYMRKHPNIIPTLTDWTTLVLMRDHKILEILSFDTDFDAVKNMPEFTSIKRIYNASQL